MGGSQIDWLTVSSTAELGMVRERVRALIGTVPEQVQGLRGLNGYEHREEWRMVADRLAVLYHGGVNGAWSTLAITGHGCGAADFEGKADVFDDLPNVRVKRVDLALDFFGGEVTLDQARTWYESGELDKSGVRPKRKEILGFGEGDSLYFGSRKSLWMDRVYQKGLQMFHQEEDHPLRKWVRWEAEHKPKTKGILYTPPSAYIKSKNDLLGYHRPILAPYLTQDDTFCPGVRVELPTTIERCVQVIKAQYGNAFYTLRHCMTDEELLEAITGHKHHPKLYSAMKHEDNRRAATATREQGAAETVYIQ